MGRVRLWEADTGSFNLLVGNNVRTHYAILVAK